MAVKLNQHDLQFILTQIKIAEAHTAGTPLNQLVTAPHLPYGLRTVDGSYNNVIPGRELWGAADQTMPRMFDPYWRNDADGDSMPFGPPGGPAVTNNDYGVNGQPGSPMVNGGHSGNVADADPRLISNLIVDQTPTNPAAIMAALQLAGFEGTAAELSAAMLSISAPYALIRAAEIANHRVASWQNSVDQLQAAIDALDPAATGYAGRLAQLQGALGGAEAALVGAQTAAAAPNAAAAGQQAILDAAAAQHGIEFEIDGKSLVIPNVAPDEGLSAPFNGWMTFFGQFFDHGLDLISKGGNGTIYVPLDPNDPLYVPGGHTNFMVLTRATRFDGPGPDGVRGTADDTDGEQINTTTPFVDQNQTYTSHPSHQVFLREYAMVFDAALGHDVPLATGHMLDGANGGLPTWKDIKEQARELLGIDLTDRDVFNIPIIRTDLYGEFIRGADGYPQVVIGIGPDGIPNTDDDSVLSATHLGTPLNLNPALGGTEPVRTSHAFLDDIAHNAVPVLDTQGLLRPDGVNLPTDPAGNAVQFDPLTGANLEYDNELLDKHFITGDGRGNENIGLTAVHHVFHAEHNRQVEVQKLEILKSKDAAFINEWLRVDLTAAQVAALPTDAAALAAYGATLGWDGERLFQAARFATEMQYQHLVFEEFGRKIQPMIDVFVFNTITDIDPAIFSEFANVVYRFGHSMLTEEIGRMFLDEQGRPIRYDVDGNAVLVTDPLTEDNWGNDIGLIEAFLNPGAFDLGGTISHEQAAGAIFRGMTRVHGNEIDEFIVDALRNNLLGLPLDLATINIARGRDTGMPTLNQAREQLFAATNSTFVKPYSSWTDFATNLKTPASIINFIAAYGLHASIVAAGDDVATRRDAATLLVLGGAGAPTDRIDFLNSTGSWSPVGADGIAGTADDKESGLNLIDLWVGGLAEKKMPFGGFLGSTFNAVFEAQLEMLQDLDRFYYLTRTQGLNLLNELENNAFSKMIMVNTDMTDPGADGVRGTEDDIVNYHVGVDSFAKHDFVLHVDPTKQVGADPTHEDPVLNAVGLTKVQRDNLATLGPDANYIRFIGGEHVAFNGTAGDDTIIADYGDDAIWGGAGNDRIEGGAGVDLIVGGAGDDIITDSGDTGDFIKGEEGDDVIANANGLDILMGGDGKDVFLVGVDGTEVFAGEGDDFILGGADIDFLMGNEGDDWIEGGDGFDTLAGDNSELFFNSTIIGHDVLLAGENENDFDAESGDDIMVQGESVMRNEGMLGFDWAIHKDNRIAADSDMRIPIFTNVAADILRDRFDQTEGLSGWKHNDILRGDDRGSSDEIERELDMTGHELTQAGINRINGLRELLGDLVNDLPPGFAGDLESVVGFAGGNIILGGDGHDVIEGRGGDDFIHGDAWLNVRISIRSLDGNGNVTATEAFTVDSLKQVVTVGGVTKALSELLLDGTIKPRQLQIVREIKYDEDATGDVDTAVFAGNKDWYEITHLDGGIVKVARREQEEIDPKVNEGVDTLVGIERIQFADQIYTIRETGNINPTGRLQLGPLPAEEDQPLTVNALQVRDLNNANGLVTAITYRWQVERNDGTGDYIDIPGASGTTFTPGDDHAGLRIRVLGIYTDGGGVIETVTSAPTDPVIGINDQPTGPLLISDMTPTEGNELTATVAFTDPDGISDAFEEALLSYRWQSATTSNGPWTDVSDAAGGDLRNFTPTGNMVGRVLRVVVDYVDDGGNAHQVVSGVTAVVGNSVTSSAAVITGDNNGPLNAGDNFVQGGNNNNSITGLGGDDVINGGGGNDTINGGAGRDRLNGGSGNDTISGGLGDDTIIQGITDGTDSINGGDGLDTLTVVETVLGANDTANVTLTGGLITSVNGATVTGVESAQLDLRGGTDTLIYNATTDLSVNLQAGTATGLSFVRGVDSVTGGSGHDAIVGNLADNVLNGGAGNDTLRGGFGNDTLIGGADNDLLYGEAGDDILRGGAGNDRLDGAAGNDTVSYVGATAAVTVTLMSQAVQNTVGAGNDMLVSIENLTGSNHNDTLSGNGAANVIDGGAGADTMTGGAGDDTYAVDNAGDVVTEGVGGGNDTVRSSLGSYTLAANAENLVLAGTGNSSGTGNGLDNRLTGNSGNNALSGGLGVDTVVLAGSITDNTFALGGGGVLTVARSGAGTDTLTSIENAEIGGVSYNIVAGTNAGNNPLNGTAGADLLLGFNGDDTLTGGLGDDLLMGGAGNDSMAGGAGNDTYVVTDALDFVSEAAAGSGGIDTIISTVSRTLTTAAQVAGDVENLILVGNSSINGTGNALANTITGNNSSNTLLGADGADTLIGNGGSDTLNGGAHDDVLEGGAGNDTLVGGTGSDTAVFSGPAGNYRFNLNANGLASVTDMVGGEGTDTLNGIEFVKFGDGPALAIASVAGGIPTGPSIIFGTNGADTIVGGTGGDVIVGGAGDDILNGSDVGDGDNNASPGTPDDDVFIWNVGDGFDTINGGREAADGDTFQIVGNNQSETFRIYTYAEAVARIGFVGSDETEIIVTRMVGGVETAIAELTEIEEIVVNGSGVSGNGTSGGDTFEMFGNFDLTTNLRPDTITILGSNGDDVINITSLQSAHRIVFKTGGGADVIIGALRPQDVVELPDGNTIEDYVVTTNADGSTTIATEGHSVRFFSNGGMPQFGTDPEEEVPPVSGGGDDDDEDDDDDNGPGDDDDDDCGCDDDEDDDTSAPPLAAGSLVGTALGDVLTGTVGGDLIFGLAGTDYIVAGNGADVIRGDQGDDFIYAEGGRDVVFAGEGDDDVFGGADDDMLYGEAGDDWISGEAGSDLIDAGKGNDEVHGGAGQDRFVASIGDGNDTYDGGAEVDTLDMGSLTAAVQVNLGTGVGGRGSVTGTQSGTDTLYGVENVTTGSGNDTITASNAVNVIDGGGGNDVFVFGSAEAADGDTIRNFETGDKIDLSGIDANSGVAGNQAFTLVSGQAASAPAQLVVTHETREDGDYTVISGNTGNGNEPEFRIEIAGSRNLTGSDFHL